MSDIKVMPNTEIIFSTDNTVFILDEVNKNFIECIPIYQNKSGAISMDHTGARREEEIIGYTPKLVDNSHLANTKINLFNDKFMREALKDFGDFVLEEARLGDMGGKIRIERVQNWMDENL